MSCQSVMGHSCGIHNPQTKCLKQPEIHINCEILRIFVRMRHRILTPSRISQLMCISGTLSAKLVGVVAKFTAFSDLRPAAAGVEHDMHTC